MDKLLRDFEAAWRTENPPQVSDFLPEDSCERQAILPELVLLDLEFRIKRGEPARVETYLEAFPELRDRRQEVLELLVTEFELRKRLDSTVKAEDYHARFPEFAADLPQHFQKVLAERSHDGAASTMRMAALEATRKSAPLLPGCEVLRELGRGGMGIVYLARQPALDRLVAVKVLRAIARADQQECLRFIREIQAAAKLRHPHIVQLYEVGEVEGQPYCLLEYMEGGSLAERLQTMLPRGAEAAGLVETMARAMHFAHEHGIVHRDLKPANILLSAPAQTKEPGDPAPPEFVCPGTIVKIADFGLAKRMEEEDGHTRTGMILGTASYKAPEQAAGKPGDTAPATDVYSLGAILYELLTGRPPFQGTTAVSILEQVKYHDPVPPSRLQPKAPRDLETICLKCLEKEPRRRYATALALAEDLERFQEGKHILARPTPWWEKTLKWSRRQPLAASVLAALFLSMALGIAGMSWQWYRAEDRAIEALAERAAKEVQRKEVVNRFYFNQIARAQQAWISNRPLETARLLEQCQDATPELCGWELDYLVRQSQPSGLTLTGHANDVRGIVVTPDGRRLISGDGNWLGDPAGGQIIIWDLQTGKPLRRMPDVGDGVQDLALSRDGRWLAAACANGEIRIWDLEGSEAIAQVLPSGKGNVIHAIAFSPKGDRLASAGLNGSVQIWNPITGKFIEQITVHRGNASGVAYSPDGKWFAHTGRDGVLFIRNADTLAEIHKFSVASNATAVTFSPDSRYVALGTYSGQVHVWDLHADQPRTWVYAVDASWVRSLHFSPDSRSLAMCMQGGPARLVEIASGKTVAELRGHERGVMRVAFSPAGRHVFTAGIDGVVRSWDLTDRTEPYEFRAHSAFLDDIAFSPDGNYLAVTGGRNPSLRIRDTQQTLIRRRIDASEVPLVCRGHTGWLTCVAYRPDGLQMASGAEDKTVILWNANTGSLEHRLGQHQGTVTRVAYGFGGQTVVSASEDGYFRAWDSQTGTLRYAAKEHDGPVLAMACSSARAVAVTGGLDCQICVWDIETGACISKLKHAAGTGVTGAALSPDGSLLACAFADWTIRLFEVGSNGQLFEHGEARRMAVRFGADENRVGKLKSGPQRIGLVFSKDGRRLVSTAPKCAVQMWDVGSVQEAFVFPHSSSYFMAAAFSPDGERLATSYADTVVIWDASEREQAATPALAEQGKSNRTWHREQAEAAVRGENWFGVCFHIEHYLKLDPSLPREWYRLATAYLAQGDAVNHRRVCAEMLAKMGASTNTSTCLQTTYVCVVDPHGGGNPALLKAVASRASKASNTARRAAGAAHFRLGDLASALAEFEASALSFTPRAWDFLFLAMIYHKLGDTTKARENFELANERMKSANPYFDWRERQEVKTLHDEAIQVLKIPVGSGTPRKS